MLFNIFVLVAITSLLTDNMCAMKTNEEPSALQSFKNLLGFSYSEPNPLGLALQWLSFADKFHQESKDLVNCADIKKRLFTLPIAPNVSTEIIKESRCSKPIAINQAKSECVYQNNGCLRVTDFEDTLISETKIGSARIHKVAFLQKPTVILLCQDGIKHVDLTTGSHKLLLAQTFKNGLFWSHSSGKKMKYVDRKLRLIKWMNDNDQLQEEDNRLLDSEGRLNPLCFDNEAKRIAIGAGHNILVRDISKKKTQDVYLIQAERANSGSFNNNGQWLIALDNYNVKVWDLSYKVCLACIRMRDCSIAQGAFYSDDNQFLFLRQKEKFIRVDCASLKNYTDFVNKDSFNLHKAVLLYYLNHAYEAGLLYYLPHQLQIIWNQINNENGLFTQHIEASLRASADEVFDGQIFSLTEIDKIKSWNNMLKHQAKKHESILLESCEQSDADESIFE